MKDGCAMTAYSTIIKGGVLIDTRRSRYDTRLPEDSGEWRRAAPRGMDAPARSFGKRMSVRVPYGSPLPGASDVCPPGQLRTPIAAATCAAITVGLEWLLFAHAPVFAGWIVPVFLPPAFGVLACAAVLGPGAGMERRMFTAWLGLMMIYAAVSGIALWEKLNSCMLLSALLFGVVYAMFAAPVAVVGSKVASWALQPLWRMQRRRARTRHWQRPATPNYRALTRSELGSSSFFIPLAQAVALGLVVLITELLGVRFEAGVPWMPLVTGFLAGLVCSLGLGAERSFEAGELVKAALIGQLYWGPVMLVVMVFSPELALLWPLESLCGTTIGAYTAERLIFRHRRGAAQP